MTEELKIIAKKDIKPGMFVQSYGAGTFRDPFVKVERFIESFEDIIKYIPDDIEKVEIVADKILWTESPESKKQSTADEAAASLSAALPESSRIHEEALSYARKFIGDVRNGKSVRLEEAEPMVGSIIDSLSTNLPAAVTLAFLKKFDEYTYTHCINGNLFSLLLGKDLGFGLKELYKLGLAAMFHDVGKGRIPSQVLNKPGKLTNGEFKLMKEHPMLGLTELRKIKGLDLSILRGVVEHHERVDGKGYPRGLGGDKIHPFAKIIAIADVYDALTSVRVYKKVMTPAKALSLMFKWKSSDFDTDYLDRFIRIMGIYPPGTLVQLEDGRFALVLETNESSSLMPKVKVLYSKAKKPVPAECIDLAAQGSGGKEIKVLRQPDPSELGIDMQQLARFLV